VLKLAFLFLIAITISFGLHSQEWPTENRALNYRLIGFTVPPRKHIDSYRLEIASGNYQSADSFQENTIQSKTYKVSKMIAVVPYWNTTYTWRVAYLSKGRKPEYGPLRHFSTGYFKFADTNNMRLDIVEHHQHATDEFVFVDASRVLYDMDGRPLWYVPNVGNKMTDSSLVRDLKISPDGTITFLTGGKTDDQAYEIDYNGNILWEAPNDGALNGEASEHYHHEFTRLHNGNYMLLGTEYAPLQWVRGGNSGDGLFVAPPEESKATKLRERAPFGTIIEYDRRGKVVWSWKSADYFKGRDLRKYQTNNPEPIANSPSISAKIDNHENAFYYDERRGVVYVSFKKINLILKLRFSDKQVLSSFGGPDNEGEIPGAPPLFCGQHSCGLTSDGKLYLFNNNDCLPEGTPQVLLLQEPSTPAGLLHPFWTYNYSPGDEETNLNRNNSVGGNVVELPEHKLFVSMCSPFDALLIVNERKEVLWDARLVIVDDHSGEVHAYPTYRASPIKNRGELERLVFYGE
jgi:Arylsulfotransferase (ASST)